MRAQVSQAVCTDVRACGGPEVDFCFFLNRSLLLIFFSYFYVCVCEGGEGRQRKYVAAPVLLSNVKTVIKTAKAPATSQFLKKKC